MEWIYLILLLVGLFYALAIGILGGVLGSSDMGGHQIDISHDVSGHVDTGSGVDHGTIQFSPLSPAVMATFIGTFGATGLVCIKLFHLRTRYHLPISLASGFMVAGITWMLFQKLFSATQSSSHPDISEVINLEAEVLVPIPEKGLGQVAYTIRGTRSTSPARSEYAPISANRTVIIKKVVGDIVYVEPTP